MIKSDYLGFLLFAGMIVVFFILPDMGFLQKPFRIFLCLSFVLIFSVLLVRKEISQNTLWPLLIGGFLILIMLLRGTLQSSMINAYLCLIGLLCLPFLYFDLTALRRDNIHYLYALCIFSFIAQFLTFTSADGRPTLAYEINHAGAYLFLFFLLCEALNFRIGKLLVIILSLFMLSRLLLFSIALYYLVRISKKHFRFILHYLNATFLFIAGYLCIILFSFWYTQNMRPNSFKNQSMSRVVKINDDSNTERFTTDNLAIKTISDHPFHINTLLGTGPIENFINSTSGARNFPHNELLDAILEYGWITVIFFLIVTHTHFNQLVSFGNIEYFIPILFYTLIFWVRYLIVPSLEMIFILLLLNLTNHYGAESALPARPN